MINIIKLQIINKDNEVLFESAGERIDAVYNGVYNDGDKIVVLAPDTEYVALKLDEYLKESIIFMPTSSLEFPVPSGKFKAGYDKEAFAGDSHKLLVYEPEDSVKYGTRNISLNSHDIRGKKR